MLQSLVKSLVSNLITDFAISPTPITAELPYFATQQRPRRGRGPSSSCPVGLVRATVLDTKATWVEQYGVGCGDILTSHDVSHHNGILVRIQAEDLDPKVFARLRKDKHASYDLESDELDLVVSHKVLFSPWSEYEPVKLERERLAREDKERHSALTHVADRLGIPLTDDRAAPTKSRVEFLTREVEERDPSGATRLRESADFVADERRWRNNRPTPHAFFGFVTMPYSHAVALADELKELREFRAARRRELEGLA